MKQDKVVGNYKEGGMERLKAEVREAERMLEKAEKEVELRRENLRILKGKLEKGKVITVDENANETIEAVSESIDDEQEGKAVETEKSEVVQSLENKKEETENSVEN